MLKFTRLASVFLISFCFLTPALAQESPPKPYCESTLGFDQFDFWVGEWDVYFNNDTKPLVGHNSITKRSNGCLVMESWVNAQGGDGYSIRHFNPATGTWQMFWVSDGYTVKTEGVQIKPGEILLEGEIHYFSPEVITGFRVRFRAQEDGTVRQFAEQYNPETETWELWFDGIYERSATDRDNP